MLKTIAAQTKSGRVLLVDSITKIDAADEGAHVVSASHGGTSSGEFALAVPLASVFFNDAGVGKDSAGIAALDMLQARGVAAGAVSHLSARIGDSGDAWENGIISHVNVIAHARGFRTGQRLNEILTTLIAD